MDPDPHTDPLRRARHTLIRRWARPWNWAALHLGLGLLGLALLTRGALLAATGLILTAVSCFDLPLPPINGVWERLTVAGLHAERAWLDAHWTRAKRFQAGLLGLGLALTVWALWRADLALLLLLAGAVALWRVWLSNRALGLGQNTEVDGEDQGKER